MSAIKILSENDLLKAASIPSRKTKVVTWRGVDIVVKEILSLQEYLNLIKCIIRDSKGADDNFLYEMIDFSAKVNIIGSYAFIELPKDLQKLYGIVYETDLYEVIIKSINYSQYSDIMDAICFYTGFRGEENESS